MVIVEDLHRIDEQTLELLNLSADSIGTAKFLQLVNYRLAPKRLRLRNMESLDN